MIGLLEEEYLREKCRSLLTNHATIAIRMRNYKASVDAFEDTNLPSPRPIREHSVNTVLANFHTKTQPCG